MINELDQIILRLAFVKECIDDNIIADSLDEIIDDLREWANENFSEATDDD